VLFLVHRDTTVDTVSTKLLSQVNNLYLSPSGTLSPFSGLHCASLFRIVEVVAGLIEMEYYNINLVDSAGNVPFTLAARNGYEGVVRKLLEREEVIPDKPDKYNLTPLSHAARRGHEGVVKILLEREEVNPDNYGRTPLSHAAQNGRDGVVKIQLGREDVNPDKPENRDRTSLLYATKYASLGVADYKFKGVAALLQSHEAVKP